MILVTAKHSVVKHLCTQQTKHAQEVMLGLSSDVEPVGMALDIWPPSDGPLLDVEPVGMGATTGRGAGSMMDGIPPSDRKPSGHVYAVGSCPKAFSRHRDGQDGQGPTGYVYSPTDHRNIPFPKRWKQQDCIVETDVSQWVCHWGIRWVGSTNIH